MTVIVDSSVWVDFFRGTPHTASLAEELEAGEVLLHPWVLGELVLGSLGPKRAAVLGDLRLLPTAPVAMDHEVYVLVEAQSLHGRGIGWADAHLLASAHLARVRLWTLDRRLALVARTLDLA